MFLLVDTGMGVVYKLHYLTCCNGFGYDSAAKWVRISVRLPAECSRWSFLRGCALYVTRSFVVEASMCGTIPIFFTPGGWFLAYSMYNEILSDGSAITHFEQLAGARLFAMIYGSIL